MLRAIRCWLQWMMSVPTQAAGKAPGKGEPSSGPQRDSDGSRSPPQELDSLEDF
jgi:hypothetical protein